MNKPYILHNLKEGLEQLTELIKELETDSDYEYGDYIVDMSHLYHHINTAWNARDSTKIESEECSNENFRIWRRFPTDIEMKN
jgi:hypothetical protein